MVGPIFLGLGYVMGHGRKDVAAAAQEAKGDTQFGDQLAETIASSIARAKGGGGGVQITVSERQDSGAGAGTRQYVITVDPVASRSVSAVAQPAGQAPAAAAAVRAPLETDWIPPLRSATSGSVFDMENPIPKVKDLLVKVGVNPIGMQFELLDDVINNLGGSYVNHLMRVTTPNGRVENYAVEYIHRNPSITAHEIVAQSKLATA
jgi:hypothetical protein